jgi:hypothetical protein
MKFKEIVNFSLWKQLPYDIKLSLFVAVVLFHKRRHKCGIPSICKDLSTLKSITNKGNSAYIHDFIEYPIDISSFPKLAFGMLDCEQNIFHRCLNHFRYQNYFTIVFDDPKIRNIYGNTLYIYRFNKKTKKFCYTDKILYQESLSYNYHYIKLMLSNNNVFMICKHKKISEPLFVIDYNKIRGNVYHLTENSLKCHRVFRFFRRYLNIKDCYGRIIIKIKELKRIKRLKNMSLDIERYNYLFNKITLNPSMNSFTDNLIITCYCFRDYKIKFISDMSEIITTKNTINNLVISPFNNEFERYYKLLWQFAPQEIIDYLMGNITNFNEYVYDNY